MKSTQAITGTFPANALIRDLRNERALTLEELAEKVDLTPAYLSMVETGKKKLSPKALQRVAVALGVGYKWLYEELNQKNAKTSD